MITAKKLALELDVSVDELISDEDVKDLQVNYGIWKSERIKDKKHLQVLQKRILDFIQIVGAVFLAFTILLRVQLDMREMCIRDRIIRLVQAKTPTGRAKQ